MKSKLLFLFLSVSAAVHASDFRYVFGEDYDKALDFLKSHKDVILKTTSYYGNDTAVVVSTIFPELIRYSLVKDFLETKALEFLYVNGGKDAADFSVGDFQMKPSFIEDMERIVTQSKKLSNKYPNVLMFASSNEMGMRKERLDRLKSLEWQIIYANCFYDILMHKFPEIAKRSRMQQVQFFSTAYNGGFQKSMHDIFEQGKNKLFPYGPKYRGEQYAYCDIAVNFYNKYFKLYMLFPNKNESN